MIRSDASQLRKLSRDLRKASPALVRAVQRELRSEGRKIAEDAATKAGWSSRIPGSIKVGANGLIGVTISAGGAAAPHAKGYENNGRLGNFRHPLNYPNQSGQWASQAARPFLHPALIDELLKIRDALTIAATEAIQVAVKGA